MMKICVLQVLLGKNYNLHVSNLVKPSHSSDIGCCYMQCHVLLHKMFHAWPRDTKILHSSSTSSSTSVQNSVQKVVPSSVKSLESRFCTNLRRVVSMPIYGNMVSPVPAKANQLRLQCAWHFVSIPSHLFLSCLFAAQNLFSKWIALTVPT